MMGSTGRLDVLEINHSAIYRDPRWFYVNCCEKKFRDDKRCRNSDVIIIPGVSKAIVDSLTFSNMLKIVVLVVF